MSIGMSAVARGTIWAGINTLALVTKAWDPYPYILLNLLLSMLAGLQGAILLIAGGSLYTIGALVYASKWPNPLPRTLASMRSSTYSS